MDTGSATTHPCASEGAEARDTEAAEVPLVSQASQASGGQPASTAITEKIAIAQTSKAIQITGACARESELLFDLDHLAAGRFSGGDNLLLLRGRNDIVVRHFHREATAALCH